MRVVALISAMVLIASGSALAQTWKQYRNRDLRVAIDFPGDPTVKDVAYITRTGATIPARQITLARDGNRYVLTMVHFTTGPSADEQAVEHAAQVLRRRGQVRVAGENPYDPGIPGRQLSILERDRRTLLASIYMYEHWLYIADGSVPAGASPPVQFQQSMTILDAAGNDLDLDTGGPNNDRSGG